MADISTFRLAILVISGSWRDWAQGSRLSTARGGISLRNGFLGCLTALAVANPTSASPLYSATAGAIGPNAAATHVEASYDVSVPISGVDLGRTSQQAFAAAGPDGLRASSRATLTEISNYVDGNINFGVGATASMGFTDFILTGPACCGTGPVPISLNLNLDSGTYLTNLSASSSSGELNAQSAMNAFLTVSFMQQYSFITISKTFEIVNFSQSNSNGTVTSSGSLSSGVLTTPSVSLYVNIPIRMQVTLNTNTFAGATGFSANDVNVLADSLSDFSDTVTFPTIGAVFNLPSGYTIDSVDANVVGNQFIPVPVPPTFWLTASGLAALLPFRARRHRDAEP